MTEIAVLGAGLMGHALALVYALGGHNVRLTDSNAETLARAPALIETARATLMVAGEIEARWTEQHVQSVIVCDPSLEATVAGAQIVQEAIVELPDAKRALYEKLDALLPEGVIIASNTSFLDIFPLMPERRQAHTVIAHWYTPPYLVDLVDVVPGPHTDPAVVERVRDLVAAMGKVPVVLNRFITGYIANRLQSAMILEVARLLDEGYATPRDIDDSVLHGLALRLPILGHLAKLDFTGLELIAHSLRNRTYIPPEPFQSSASLNALLAEGRKGVMSGRGFFDWGDRTAEELFRERDLKLLALKKALRTIGPMEGA